ncbi:MAG TPA: HAMP domain-containing sensor histidine kinase [Terriglobales bacterium]|nr:HAMP domain-containing sensor histidine kinase [Terriglobales bacterium]
MSLRARLVALFTITIALTVFLVAALVSSSTTRAYERIDEDRTEALVSQFHQEFSQRGADITRQVEAIADSDEMRRIAVDMASAPDYSAFWQEADHLNAGRLDDLLELTAQDGTIISSKQWPARFGFKEAWIAQASLAEWKAQSAFLKQIELPDGDTLAIITVRPVEVADKIFYLAGGERLDRKFMATLALPRGMDAWLYRAPLAPTASATLLTSQGVVPWDESDPRWSQLNNLISGVQQQRSEQHATVAWADSSGASPVTQTVYGIPLSGRNNDVLGVLLVSSSRAELLHLTRRIQWTALAVAGGGILFGILLSMWLAARVTRPVERLAVAADEVAAGHLGTQVDDSAHDEIGRLAYAFNRMTRELLEQRERLLQSERVAAWRELARRLAHELKNPLFPLQITVENMLRAKESSPEQFEEVFQEGAETLLAEVANLKTIIGRFSDFSKMPAPQMQAISINEAAKRAVKVYEPQFSSKDRPLITPRWELDATLDKEKIDADPDLLHRALSNLVLNAQDAIQEHGTLTLRTRNHDTTVRIEVEDSGVGLTEEECQRLFTPYYTSKQYGTGLGLAIVQSIVSDHHGKIWVNSTPGKGTTFVMELPKHPL